MEDEDGGGGGGNMADERTGTQRTKTTCIQKFKIRGSAQRLLHR